jgi:hypothetical protein
MQQPLHARKPDLPAPPVPQAAAVGRARSAADTVRRRRPERSLEVARKL